MPPTPGALPPVIETFRKAVATYSSTRLENDKAAAEWARCLAHLQANGQGGPGYPDSDRIEDEAQANERRLKEVAAIVTTAAQSAFEWAAAQQLDCRPFRRYLKNLHPADYRDIEQVLAKYQEAEELAALRAEVTANVTMPSGAGDVVPDAVVPPPTAAKTTPSQAFVATDRPIVDPHRFQIQWRGKVCDLANRRVLFHLATALLRRPGEYVSFETLQEKWGGKASDEAVRTAMKELRKLFRAAGMDELAEGLETSQGSAVLKIP